MAMKRIVASCVLLLTLGGCGIVTEVADQAEDEDVIGTWQAGTATIAFRDDHTFDAKHLPVRLDAPEDPEGAASGTWSIETSFIGWETINLAIVHPSTFETQLQVSNAPSGTVIVDNFDFPARTRVTYTKVESAIGS
jgi:hypothetical protein